VRINEELMEIWSNEVYDTKAAYKPFDVDKARAKAKAEMARRSNARKLKQQMDTE